MTHNRLADTSPQKPNIASQVCLRSRKSVKKTHIFIFLQYTVWSFLSLNFLGRSHTAQWLGAIDHASLRVPSVITTEHCIPGSLTRPCIRPDIILKMYTINGHGIQLLRGSARGTRMLSSTSKAKGLFQNLFTTPNFSRTIGGLESYWHPRLWIQMRQSSGCEDSTQVHHNSVPSSRCFCFVQSLKIAAKHTRFRI